MFEVGQHVKTRDGRDARVICVDRDFENAPILALVQEHNREQVYTYQADGRYTEFKEQPCDLIPPKRSGTVWINVYEDAQLRHLSRGDADRGAAGDRGLPRLACIEVDWEEGDGL